MQRAAKTMMRILTVKRLEIPRARQRMRERMPSLFEMVISLYMLCEAGIYGEHRCRRS